MDTTQMTFEQLCELFNYEPKRRPINTAEAAEILHLRPITLDIKRIEGGGPRYFRPAGSRKVLYSERDVLAYLASGARTSTSQQPASQRERRASI
jgi:hypothetical protein